MWAFFLTAGTLAGKSLAAQPNIDLNVNIFPVITCITFFITLIIFLFYKKKKQYLSFCPAPAANKSNVNKNPQNLAIMVLLLIASFNFLAIGTSTSYFYYYRQDKNIFRSLYDYILENQDLAMVVEGRISSHPEIKKGYISFILNSQKITIKNLSLREVSLQKVIQTHDAVNVRLKTSDYYSYKRDDYIQANIILSLRYNEPLLIMEDFHIEKIEVKGVMPFFYSLRQRSYECISRVYNDKLGAAYAGIATALILGNDNFISNRILEGFRHSGAYHLLAISGLHVSFFIYLLVSFLKIFYPDSKKLRFKNTVVMVLILLFLLFYNFLVGQKVSALRASIMALLVIIAGFWQKESDRKIVLSMTYIFLLSVFPEFLNNIGFWLSFAAMAAIIYINRIFSALFGKLFRKIKSHLKSRYILTFRSKTSFPADKTSHYPERNYFIKIFITTISINIFIMPVMLYFFGEFPLISPLTNILIIPVFYLLLFILILASAASLFWPPVGSILVLPAKPLILYILKVVNFFGNKKSLIITVKDLSWLYPAIYYLFLLVLLFLLNKYVESD